MRALQFAVLGVLAGCAAVTASPLPDAPEGPPSIGHPLEGAILDVASGARIGEAVLAARLGAADVAILGEIHDNPAHHRRQARLVAALAPSGVAFEMVPEASEEGIAVFLEQGGEPGEIGPAIGWERLGWPDWSLYRPVFEAAFAGGRAAYVAGGGVASAALRNAMREDARAGFGPGAASYGLDAPLPPDQQEEAVAEMVAAHCDALPAAAAGPMVEAQRLRDARFAHAVRRARAASGDGRVVLITGNGHARRDRGVPVYLAESAPGLEVAVLGQLEVDPARTDLADYAAAELPYDFVWFAPPAERGDPCDAFR